MTPAIRGARLEDAEALASLTTQLGYPSTADQLRERLAAVTASDQAAVFVATDPQDRAIGWVLVDVQLGLASDRHGHIAGIIVDEAVRSGGIGHALLACAERWASERGCTAMRLASRMTRERAHRFYLREGYAVLKSSHVFEKPLTG